MAIGRIFSRLRTSFIASAATRAHPPPGERGTARRLFARLQVDGMAAAATRGQRARACALARLEAIRAKGGAPGAILAFAEARAHATHAYAIRGQRQAGPAAAMAALRVRQASDMAIRILLRVVFGNHAPSVKEVFDVLEFDAKYMFIVLCLNKVLYDLSRIYYDISPVLQTINGWVSMAPECVCPFVGIESLPFEVFPVEEGLVAVLELVGTCAGVMLMVTGGLCVCFFLDIKDIMLPNVDSKLIKYHAKNAESRGADVATGDADKDSKATKTELCAFFMDFVNVDQATLFDLILAANYLDIKDLLDLTCQMGTNMIKGKSPEEIRKTFNIKNDFTPEEVEIRRKNQWAFE